ncbi:hypothetical protein RFI_11112 [Reticulomyxa filosa]|uniref:Uncharacterized protein n=1 Tax=Reticulomyxa filosa TaxID=46433 RepID=X6NJ52_RETFI|nr:hypothetical protein RFI_11112 [Reticulomyxa filosa]|eukprot:ETO26026.1 hypothetical protein RFI_11112 [Reticulomyxa filosa]
MSLGTNQNVPKSQRAFYTAVIEELLKKEEIEKTMTRLERDFDPMTLYSTHGNVRDSIGDDGGEAPADMMRGEYLTQDLLDKVSRYQAVECTQLSLQETNYERTVRCIKERLLAHNPQTKQTDKQPKQPVFENATLSVNSDSLVMHKHIHNDNNKANPHTFSTQNHTGLSVHTNTLYHKIFPYTGMFANVGKKAGLCIKEGMQTFTVTSFGKSYKENEEETEEEEEEEEENSVVGVNASTQKNQYSQNLTLDEEESDSHEMGKMADPNQRYCCSVLGTPTRNHAWDKIDDAMQHFHRVNKRNYLYKQLGSNNNDQIIKYRMQRRALSLSAPPVCPGMTAGVDIDKRVIQGETADRCDPTKAPATKPRQEKAHLQSADKASKGLKIAINLDDDDTKNNGVILNEMKSRAELSLTMNTYIDKPIRSETDDPLGLRNISKSDVSAFSTRIRLHKKSGQGYALISVGPELAKDNQTTAKIDPCKETKCQEQTSVNEFSKRAQTNRNQDEKETDLADNKRGKNENVLTDTESHRKSEEITPVKNVSLQKVAPQTEQLHMNTTSDPESQQTPQTISPNEQTPQQSQNSQIKNAVKRRRPALKRSNIVRDSSKVTFVTKRRRLNDEILQATVIDESLPDTKAIEIKLPFQDRSTKDTPVSMSQPNKRIRRHTQNNGKKESVPYDTMALGNATKYIASEENVEKSTAITRNRRRHKTIEDKRKSDTLLRKQQILKRTSVQQGTPVSNEKPETTSETTDTGSINHSSDKERKRFDKSPLVVTRHTKKCTHCSAKIWQRKANSQGTNR